MNDNVENVKIYLPYKNKIFFKEKNLKKKPFFCTLSKICLSLHTANISLKDFFPNLPGFRLKYKLLLCKLKRTLDISCKQQVNYMRIIYTVNIMLILHP